MVSRRLSRILALPMLGALLSLPSSSARAAYDKPVTWADMGALNLQQVFRSRYASPANLLEPSIPEGAIARASTDEDRRVSPAFRVPDGLRPAVEFWLRIYTEYTTQHVVIFDQRHPEIVYDVLDFRGLFKTSRNLAAYEIVSKRRIKAATHAYRDALLRLSRGQGLKKPDEVQKKVLAALSKSSHKHKFKDFAHDVRTQTGQRDNIVKGLLAAEAYFPQMEKLFEQQGVPIEVTRLSLVESSFNLNAVSRVGATGVWQFMLRSALEYMKVDDIIAVDERLSPLKSTVAAAKLLKRNLKVLKHWPLAITSYNHGLKSFVKLPRHKREAEDIVGLFAPCLEGKKAYLGFASRNYYTEFLAVLHAETYRDLFYGSAPAPRVRPVTFERIAKSSSGLDAAIQRGIPLQEFKFYNPDIQDLRRTLPRGFWIAVPTDTATVASAQEPLARTENNHDSRRSRDHL